MCVCVCVCRIIVHSSLGLPYKTNQYLAGPYTTILRVFLWHQPAIFGYYAAAPSNRVPWKHQTSYS